MKTNSIYLCFADPIDGPTYVSIDDCLKLGFPQDITGKQLELVDDCTFYCKGKEYVKLSHPMWNEVWDECCLFNYQHAKNSIHDILTDDQKLALVRLAERQEYSKGCICVHVVSDGALMVKSLGGMTLGIEADGHTHS